MKNLHLILFLFLAAHLNINAQSDSLGYPQYDQSSKNNGLASPAKPAPMDRFTNITVRA